MNTVVQFFLIFFWAIPVGVASAMVSFEKLEKELPFLKNCKKIRLLYQFFHSQISRPIAIHVKAFLIFIVEKLGPVVTGFISGFLSTVVIVAFFALLPMVCIDIGPNILLRISYSENLV